MHEYPRIERFVQIAAKSAGQYDFTAADQLSIMDALLKKHHGFVMTAVNAFMQALTNENLKAMSVCEADIVRRICDAHMWTFSAYLIIERVVDDVYRMVCLEA